MKTVAVIGASNNRRKFGNIAVRAFQKAGYHVIPITPSASEVEGLRAYASVLDVAETIDLATVYVRPEVGEQVIEQIAEKGIREVWLNPGAGSPAIVARARALGIRPVEGCSIIRIGFSPSEF
jgi:predicted CoA-binding protein